MRDKLNCPNCGAPLDGEKCPYCGTTFYDFSSIEDGKPCYMRIRTGNLVHNGKPVSVLLTMRAIPKIEAITNTSETVSAYGGRGDRLVSFDTGRSFYMGVSFRAVLDKNGNLLQVEVE